VWKEKRLPEGTKEARRQKKLKPQEEKKKKQARNTIME
jgi:hypothetical protein